MEKVNSVICFISIPPFLETAERPVTERLFRMRGCMDVCWNRVSNIRAIKSSSLSKPRNSLRINTPTWIFTRYLDGNLSYCKEPHKGFHQSLGNWIPQNILLIFSKHTTPKHLWTNCLLSSYSACQNAKSLFKSVLDNKLSTIRNL